MLLSWRKEKLRVFRPDPTQSYFLLPCLSLFYLKYLDDQDSTLIVRFSPEFINMHGNFLIEYHFHKKWLWMFLSFSARRQNRGFLTLISLVSQLSECVLKFWQGSLYVCFASAPQKFQWKA